MNIISSIASKAAGIAIPAWAPWAAGALVVLAIGASSYGLGRVHEARIGAAALASYKEKAAIQTVKIVQAEAKVVTKTETVYRDRIQKIYVQGAAIEKHITDYVQPADDVRYRVNVGFMRNVDAAWSGAPVGPPEDADREPSGIPLSEVAAIEAGNATSCRVWREQALGWRAFYADQQVVFNGKAGEWWAAAVLAEQAVSQAPEQSESE
jgi:hypothetical protein